MKSTRPASVGMPAVEFLCDASTAQRLHVYHADGGYNSLFDQCQAGAQMPQGDVQQEPTTVDSGREPQSVDEWIASVNWDAWRRRLCAIAVGYARRTYGWKGDPEHAESQGISVPDVVQTALATLIRRTREEGVFEKPFPYVVAVLMRAINNVYWRRANKAEVRNREEGIGDAGFTEPDLLAALCFDELLERIDEAVAQSSDALVKRCWQLLNEGCVDPGSIRQLVQETGARTSEVKNAWRKIRKIAAEGERKSESP